MCRFAFKTRLVAVHDATTHCPLSNISAIDVQKHPLLAIDGQIRRETLMNAALSDSVLPLELQPGNWVLWELRVHRFEQLSRRWLARRQAPWPTAYCRNRWVEIEAMDTIAENSRLWPLIAEISDTNY